MIGRRNLTPDQNRLALGRRYNRTKKTHGGNREASGQNDHLPKTAASLAKMDEYQGDDPLAYVFSQNFTRRQLTESQKGMIGARYATLEHGTNRYSLETPAGVSKTVGQSIEEAAHRVGVGTSTIDRAKAIINKGVPELVAAVESGQVTVNAAAQVAKLPEHERSGNDWCEICECKGGRGSNDHRIQ